MPEPVKAQRHVVPEVDEGHRAVLDSIGPEDRKIAFLCGISVNQRNEPAGFFR
jgi:hypothetical protein